MVVSQLMDETIVLICFERKNISSSSRLHAMQKPFSNYSKLIKNSRTKLRERKRGTYPLSNFGNMDQTP